LRELPRVEAAFVSGEVSYSRVRELTRVAEPSTEAEWLELARALDMRALERRVAAARDAASQISELTTEASATTEAGTRTGASATTDKPARTEWLTQNTVRVTFELSAETWGLLERALEGARRCGVVTSGAGTSVTNTTGVGTMSDADALAAVARDALSAQHEDPDASDPRCAVVGYECGSCGKSELDTGVGPLELEPASAAALCCGKSEVHLATEGRAVKRGGPLPAALRRAVMLRDRCRCRVPGCNRRRYVDVHHIIPRGSGGEHSRSNCLLLCTTHHHLLHDGKLELSGDAEGEVCFRHAAGHSLVGADSLPDLPIGSDETTSQGGSPSHGSDSMPPRAGSSSHGAAARLLHAIGRRGGWSLDALVEKLELPAHVVASALTQLELGGSIRFRDFAYHPS
jgi:hypothetical protein